MRGRSQRVWGLWTSISIAAAIGCAKDDGRDEGGGDGLASAGTTVGDGGASEGSGSDQGSAEATSAGSSGADGSSGGSSGTAEPSCEDGLANGFETDVDCGGSCPPCADGSGCDAGADCTSFVCEAGACVPPTCEDAVPNGAETDTDCGGGACPKCEVCLHCGADTDCEPGICEEGLCGPTIVITSAVYAANCGAPTPVQTIFDECNGKKTCDYVFNYVEDIGFDPAYGCMKDLSVEYTCTGGTTVKMFYEACAPCDDMNTPTAIHLALECDACLGVGMPPE